MINLVSPFHTMTVTKSWIDGSTLYREGWVSTNDPDRERDITEPEAFLPVIDGYFAAGAPISSTHDTNSYPVGHLQAGAILRDGKVLKAASHPTDPAEFTTLPETGSGFFGRHAINDPIAINQVSKGNVGGCSFIATLSKAETLPTGGRRYLEFSNLYETTIAAYPINTKALLHIAKAYGVEQEQEEMTKEEIQAMIDAAVTKVQKAVPTPEPTVQAVTPDQLTTILTQHSDSLLSQIDAKITKAIPLDRNGVGTKAVMTPADERDADPANYIVKKANSDEELDMVDKTIIGQLTIDALLLGVRAD